MDCSPPSTSVLDSPGKNTGVGLPCLPPAGSSQPRHRPWVSYISCTGKWVLYHQRYAAKSLQLCLTLYDPIEGSPPGSPVPGILQARTLEWDAISFSNAWKWKVKVKSLSRVRLFTTPWIAGYQAPPSMGFSRQEYWSGVPLPSPLLFLLKYQLPSFRVDARWLSEILLTHRHM